MPWHHPRPVEQLHTLSEEELMNRVIRAKALMAICADQTVTLRTAEGDYEISPVLAKKLLRESKAVTRPTRPKRTRPK